MARSVLVLLLAAALVLAAMAQVPLSNDELPEPDEPPSLEMPLRVVAVTPSTAQVELDPNSRPSSVLLRGRDAITVTFSRPVIALGSDWGPDEALPATMVPFYLAGCLVSGKIRWVTTYIARFDPDIDWPAAVSFQLTLSGALMTYDGHKVPASDLSRTWAFHTSNQVMHVASVQSRSASDATDNQWNAFVPALMDDGTWSQLPEITDDAYISLYFDSAVDLESLHGNIIMTATDDPQESYTLSLDWCTEMLDTCINASLPSGTNLRVDQSYTISVLSGTFFHPYSNMLEQPLEVQVSGPYSFRIPLRLHNKASHHRLRMWIRHGIANVDDGAVHQAFTQAVHITPPLAFALDFVSPAVVDIVAEFQPSNAYTITVDASEQVLDGFGLPLLASEVTLQMESGAQFFGGAWTPYGGLLFEQTYGAPTQWSYLARQPRPIGMHPDARGSPVTVAEIKKAITALRSSDYVTFETEEQVSAQRTGEGSEGLQDDMSFSVEQLAEPTGLFMVQQGSPSWDGNSVYWESKLVSVSDVTATFIGAPDCTVIAWLTNMHTGLPVPNGRVTIYSSQYSGSSSTVSEETTAVSDGDGVAYLRTRCRSWANRDALVNVGGRLMFHANVVAGEPKFDPSVLRATLKTDRVVYRIGERIYIKGFVRDARPEPTAPAEMRIAVQWSQEHSSDVTVKVSPKYGTFATELRVPHNTDYGAKDLVLRSDTNAFVAATRVIIGDPRPPTVTMSDTAMANVYDPDNGLPLELSTATYLGTPVAFAKVTLKWTLQRGAFARESSSSWFPTTSAVGCGWTSSRVLASPATRTQLADETGIEAIVTNADGKANYLLKLDSLAEPPIEGDSILVETEWIGPTGELIQSSLTRAVGRTDVSLSIQASISEPIPGYLFALIANLVSAAGDEVSVSLEQRPMHVGLYRWDAATPLVPDPTTGAIKSLDGLSTAVQVCDAQVSAKPMPVCQFSIPNVDSFVLIATTTDATGRTVTTTLPFGKSHLQWEQDPLRTLVPLSIVPESTTYKVGDTANFQLFNPFERIQALVYVDQRTTSRVIRKQLTQGFQTISIPIDAKCIGECRLLIALASPRQASYTLPDSVVESPLADITAPFGSIQTFTYTVREQSEAALLVTTDAIIVSPGEDTELTLQLDIDDEPSAGEVTVFLVNKAWLDLAPPPSSDDIYGELLPLAQSSLWGQVSTTDLLGSQRAYENGKAIITRRLARDPWLQLSWPLRPDYGSDRDLLLSDEQFFANLWTSISEQPTSMWDHQVFYEDRLGGGGAGGGVVGEVANSGAKPQAAFSPMVADSSSTAPSPSSSSSTTSSSTSIAGKVRTDFTVTPVHELAVSVPPSGIVTLTVKAPESVGTFVVRAFAVTSGSRRYAAGETEYVVRQPVGSLNANMPRVVRLGDLFRAGATFTVSDPEFRGMVMIQLEIDCNRIGFLATSVSEIVVDDESALEPIEALFSLKPLRLGAARYRITALRESDVIDAFEGTLLVEGPQEEVFVATSMALEATSSGVSWAEGLALPSAVPHTGHLELDAGVGHLPAVQSFARALLAPLPLWATAMDELGRLVPRCSLEQYPAQSSGAEPDALRKSAVEQYAAAVRSLAYYTVPSYGLQWTLPVRYPYYNPSLNAYALQISRRTKAMLGQRTGVLPRELTTAWTTGLENGLYEYCARAQGEYIDYNLVAESYMALGIDWRPRDYPRLLSFDALVAHINDCSASSKALVALAHLYDGKPATTPLVQSIADLLLSSIRVQGRTAYVAYGSGSAHADIVASALTLELLVQLDPIEHRNTIEKLAAFVAQQDSPIDMYHSWSSQQMAYASFALAVYDTVRGSTKPNLELRVEATVPGRQEKTMLLYEHFTASNPLPVHSETAFDDLLQQSGGRSPVLGFSAKGTGEASLVAGFRFTPAEVFTEPVYRGISVTKIIQKLDLATGKPVGGMATHLLRGDHVRVTVLVATPDDVRNVMLYDPLPGALEAIDDNLFHIPGQSDGAQAYTFGHYWWWSFAGFTNKQVHANGVQFFAQWLWAGTHQVTYDAIVVTRGRFVVPPAKCWALQQPELMGLSAGGSLATTTTPLPTDVAAAADLAGFCLRDEELIPPQAPPGLHESASDVFEQGEHNQTPSASNGDSSGSFSVRSVLLIVGGIVVALTLLLVLVALIFVLYRVGKRVLIGKSSSSSSSSSSYPSASSVVASATSPGTFEMHQRPEDDDDLAF